MPSVNLNYSQILPGLKDPAPGPEVISTPFGRSLLEIQGVLNVPKEKSAGLEYITVDDIHEAVKFGKLRFDEKDKSKVTLLIGNSQRLVGTMANLDTPLGLLKIPCNEDGSQSQIDMVDIIRKKIIFKHRPLPIM
ncbi:hypothetical protein PSN45_001864 [Yamadazyma tenuis]|uniref:Ctf8-domain-containing protein n=1 Tax=Candida tenuis (strain ATCC 10573 / BCRC 21748 / CBS 615 / JCM 9827 / NBRC 10315 / NRRL Y-1498 / VKM Y-70) TaxID=590646 RepID=G3BDT2_CANTC|nr:uncharacterized protein CANTEDRAFT_95824 [Yamadazyma tenuis ATCC 10573]EGV60374.1 hypothetical protein CANTEDRAFT_95824 [Yamadazyma tenuis ATCC 10573]WEJ94380.1 hypothetical protein PSN45_001864 [Yamadazyma tenuis]